MVRATLIASPGEHVFPGYRTTEAHRQGVISIDEVIKGSVSEKSLTIDVQRCSRLWAERAPFNSRNILKCAAIVGTMAMMGGLGLSTWTLMILSRSSTTSELRSIKETMSTSRTAKSRRSTGSRIGYRKLRTWFRLALSINYGRRNSGRSSNEKLIIRGC
jgi:hypothetical protein